MEAKAVKGYWSHFAIHIEGQKFECGAIFCEIYDEKRMFDRLSFAKKHF